MDTQIALLLLTASIASGIAIYAAATAKGKGKFLCDDCRFNNDSDCLKSERPQALICTSYRAASADTTSSDHTKQ